MPTLYLVATPIGNLEDITLRALRVLREVGLIAAEDTRKTKRLLVHHGIRTPLTSFFEHSRLTKVQAILDTLRSADVAVVSEAGMPGISDPGRELVVAAVEQGFTVVPIPGPSALIAALAASGLATDRFLYLGFLPRRRNERLRILREIAAERATLVCFEAPHRLIESLVDLEEVLGDRHIAICRELTKIHEEVYRGTIASARAHFTEPRGEFTLVIEGTPSAPAMPVSVEVSELHNRLRALVEAGLSSRDAIARVAAETGLPRREVYRIWHASDE